MITKKTLDNLTTTFSILVVIGFIVYLYLDYRKTKKSNVIKPKNKIVSDMQKSYSDCPNYFEIIDNKEDNTVSCQNTHNLGKCKETYNFDRIIKENSRIFNTPETKNKMKCEWAKQCGVAWDGIDRLC